MFHRHINLIGFRGVGKTSMAFLLKEVLRLPLYDSDTYIAWKCKKSVKDILKDLGEEFFRDLESEVLRELCLIKAQVIISTGGGAVIRKENRELLRKSGYNILLVAKESVIYDRIAADKNRPPLTDKPLKEEIHSILMEREKYYNEIKDLVVDTSTLSKEQSLKLIIDFIKSAKNKS